MYVSVKNRSWTNLRSSVLEGLNTVGILTRSSLASSTWWTWKGILKPTWSYRRFIGDILHLTWKVLERQKVCQKTSGAICNRLENLHLVFILPLVPGTRWVSPMRTWFRSPCTMSSSTPLKDTTPGNHHHLLQVNKSQLSSTSGSPCSCITRPSPWFCQSEELWIPRMLS